MKCLQKLYSSPSWLVVSLCLLCTLFLTMTNTNSVSAVSDLVITIDSSVDLSQSSNRYICGGSTNIDCSQWNYAIFSFTGQSFTSGDVIEIRYGSFYTYFYPYYNPYMIQQLDHFTSAATLYQFNNFSSWLSSGTFTITLTSSLPSSCPPVEPCPEIPEHPYTEQLDEIKQAIILVPAVCLVIYFFYAIYKMIMGGVRR